MIAIVTTDSGTIPRQTARARFIDRSQMSWSGRNKWKEVTMIPPTTIRRSPAKQDLLCLSHLRWNFVFQRPQHLMSRFARERRVFYWEEPLFDATTPDLSVHVCPETGVNVVTPHLPRAREHQLTCFFLEDLMSRFVRDNAVEDPIAWFYTPMALEFFSQTYRPSVV